VKLKPADIALRIGCFGPQRTLSFMMEHLKSVEIIRFEGPQDLATVTANPPAL
jgi:hypothetical protein